MATRIRTLTFLPEIFQTTTNAQFLAATLDQIVDQPNTETIQGYVGSKFGYGVNATDYYVTEPDKVRTDYQLDPAVVFTKANDTTANDFISYPGIIDSLKIAGALTDDNSRLFESQFYSWDSFTNLDMLVNFSEYYWLTHGIPAVEVSEISGTLDVNAILASSTYTSPNGVTFTNGLVVKFTGLVTPLSYLYDPAEKNTYVVQGVGTLIQLVPTKSLIEYEIPGAGVYIPWDSTNWSVEPWDSTTSEVLDPDYVTIARNSVDLNAWTRGNRWFHIDAIKAAAEYNGTPEIIAALATPANQAKRPIIEFYPNLRLFNSGSSFRGPVDFIDTRTTDVATQVIGARDYYPDVEVYTPYTATIAGIDYPPNRNATASSGSYSYYTCNSTAGFRKNDAIVFTGGLPFGGIILSNVYYVASVVSSTQFTISKKLNGPALVLTNGSGNMTFTWQARSTIVSIASTEVVGKFALGQSIADSTNLLPTDCLISEVNIIGLPGPTTVDLTVSWPGSTATAFTTTTGVSLAAASPTLSEYALYDGATVIFTAASDPGVRNKVYVTSITEVGGYPYISLIPEVDDPTVGQEIVILHGYVNTGKDFYYNGTSWVPAQQKVTANQPPLFDLFNVDGISLSDQTVYPGSTFKGNKLFAYSIGSGTADSILGFPLKYSSVDTISDILFDVSLNLDTFTYVSDFVTITSPDNIGYVYTYQDTRSIGWQTALSPSIQYQIFNFSYVVTNPTTEFVCDIPVASMSDYPNIDVDTLWPEVQVFVNNVFQPVGSYTLAVTTTDTTVSDIAALATATEDTVVQILVYSESTSANAYYQIPINLSNNPLNQNLTSASLGDVRSQYQSIFYNNPALVGDIIGANNYRDLGNLVPYGSQIIQNSASLALPGAFLRKRNHNLFDALVYNSREYIKYKTLIVDVVNHTDYTQRYSAAAILDDAISQITASKSNEQPFFWSDMLPAKSVYITNNYTFAAATTFPLSKVYNFASANYDGVLVYRQTVDGGVTHTVQLIKGVDYTVSTTAPELTITSSLTVGDVITINEYNQTYGSYVPNTPTKLGLYPAYIPKVILDSEYSQPTYFILGHDGSYNKLYGDYDPLTGILVDFRDQALFEFESRVYNNLKLSSTIPIQAYEVLPGYFRETEFTFNEWLDLYSTGFLNWVGQNRIDYKTQQYNSTDQFTYNYWQTAEKINQEPIEQGYWRGLYQYYYDTTTPNVTPWEMLGFIEEPSWWASHYGAAPYTSTNATLWYDLEHGINWNNNDPYVIPWAVRPGLSKVLPVDASGNLVSPFVSIVGNYTSTTFRRDWKVGDDGPAELSYRRSSSYPFDFMRVLALAKPAQFFNLGVDLDNYKYNSEFNQYLVNDRSHLVISDIEVYGLGTAKTSYINWIVDYEKQVGVDATSNITNLLDSVDVRLAYRLAGFSDKAMLAFYVGKGATSTNTSSLLIPDASYEVLLYENQPITKLVYSGVVVQIVNGGLSVYGNSQTAAYFKTLKPKFDGHNEKITVEKATVSITKNYYDTEVIVPYSTVFYSLQDISQFLASYGAYLVQQGMIFDQIEYGLEVNWQQMIAELLYWAQTGWSEGNITTLNPAAKLLKIDRESNIVQPLTMRETNFILNQNLYPIKSSDVSIVRDGTLFTAQALNEGDTIAYGQFNLNNFENGIVFDNVTLFNDVIYNLITGVYQTRLYLRGTRSAEWNGTVDAQGFIYNQNNVKEWNPQLKYTKGEIVLYKNKYWASLSIVQPSAKFDETKWILTTYNEIDTGLLPNSSTRSFESTLYYDVNQANLQNDADLLGFGLIGFRPRDYMSSADFTDITQVNVYQNLIRNKGTFNAANALKGTTLTQGTLDYEIYENWAIKSGEFGGVLNNNFIEFNLNEKYLTGNPSIVALTDGVSIAGVQQEVPLYRLFNYKQPITDVNVLPTIPSTQPTILFPDAGYVNFNDVKMSSYFYSQLPVATDASGVIIPISKFYVRDYVWLANYLEKWQVFTMQSLAQVVTAQNNLNGTVTVTFAKPHNLTQYQPFAIVNFNTSIDGYYITTLIVDPLRVMISLTLPSQISTLTGYGIGLSFQSQRVAKPSDIADLPLLDSEFIKNTVWVDENNDGGWAVYRKSLNYQYAQSITDTTIASRTFGSAVATTPELGYLIGDAGSGKVRRYIYNRNKQKYKLLHTFTKGISFGTTITYADKIVAISEPTGASPNVYIYHLDPISTGYDLIEDQAIPAPPGSVNWGSALAMSGDQNWLYISDLGNTVTPNVVHVWKKSQSFPYDYEDTNTTITVPGLVLGDNFGYSLATDYYGTTLIVGAPNQDYSPTVDNWGYSYVLQRSQQTIEVQEDSLIPTTYALGWNASPSDYVYKNGTLLTAGYTISGATFTYTLPVQAGDLFIVSGQVFTLVQTLTTQTTPRIGVHFGNSVDTTTHASEIIVGAPFELDSKNNEGAVFRYTNGAGSYGLVIGTTATKVTSFRKLFINGFLVLIPEGDATSAAAAINLANIDNVIASVVGDKLAISLINQSISPVNEKLVLSTTDPDTFTELGIPLYTLTQVIECPHAGGPTQFGTVVKFNELGSFVASAPVGTRYDQTTFDFSDDENQNDDTIFDNNATQFIDSYPNAGAVYMFDYLANYDATISNPGKFVYAQSTNDTSQYYGSLPGYGLAVDFNQYHVLVGAPNFSPSNGLVVAYPNSAKITDWSVYRSSAPVVDINRIYNIQLFSQTTNETLANLDYFDPLQGKILGVARENIDVISNADPATYNLSATPHGSVWGAAQLGQIWFNTRNVRFVNYHQNDVTYNSKYWGTVFTGSDVAVYSWISSSLLPASYQGPGTPYDVTKYSIQYEINPSGALTPLYFYWVRDTNIIFTERNKTVADSVIASYIKFAKDSGISYFTPLLPSVFGLYNSYDYINAADSILHIGFSTSTNDDVDHNQYELIRSNYESDFLPGVPADVSGYPLSLYNRFLESMSGVDGTGAVVPDPYLPKAVQSGILVRPRQSFFTDRLNAIHNYLEYANEVLAQYPIVELRNPTLLYEKNPVIIETIVAGNCQAGVTYTIVTPGLVDWTLIGSPDNLAGTTFVATGPVTGPTRNTGTASFLAFAEGEEYDTTKYWSYINWWAPGYSNSVKASLQVPTYSELITLDVPLHTIVSVLANGDGRTETYILSDVDVWTRIGLANGTIEFNSALWDYSAAQLGFDGPAFAATPFDQYPSEETRYIIRALNEQIYISDLLIYRNRGLILVFEYIQTQTIESQNYLPWLNKTSLVDVNCTVRELEPTPEYQIDNQDLLAGYLSEVKPYRVVIKNFVQSYTSSEVYSSAVTDFDPGFTELLASNALRLSTASADPVRTSKVTLKFDRTSETTKLVKWVPGGSYEKGALVALNHRVFKCTLRNSDTEFSLRKWVQIQVSDRQLNAIDRIANANKLDLTGIEYTPEELSTLTITDDVKITILPLSEEDK